MPGMNDKLLVLVRHGETVGQSSIRLYGSTDVALALEGEAQVAASARELADWSSRSSGADPHGSAPRFDAVFTSPLCRAQRSAEVVLSTLAHPPVTIEPVPSFAEIDFGAWEGWTWDEVRERDPVHHARWTSDGASFRFPAGEVRAEFVERVQLAVGPTIEARFAAGARSILVVVHKGVIKAIAAHLLGRSFLELDEFDLPLGAIRCLRAGSYSAGAPCPWVLYNPRQPA